MEIKQCLLRTHTHTFKCPFSVTTQVSRYQKGKTSLDFTEARDSEWQWHQLGQYASLHLATAFLTTIVSHVREEVMRSVVSVFPSVCFHLSFESTELSHCILCVWVMTLAYRELQD